MRPSVVFGLIWIAASLVSCTQASSPPPATLTPLPSATFSPTPTLTPQPSLTSTPRPSPTSRPLVLVFYGDSVLKVGDVNQPASEGFSFVDPLKTDLPSADTVIVSNHGGRRARWGYENIQQYVLRFQPDLVSLWWGLNDLGGCPGIFDRQTNALLPYMLTAYLNEHIQYMQAQIDAMLSQHITVFVMTPLPVLGSLPWSHFTSDGQLVWENDRHCDFNLGLQQLVQAQRKLVSEYSTRGDPVYLVDAWQVYKDHPDSDKMYMDVVHPASHGVALIAQEWLRVFNLLDLQR